MSASDDLGLTSVQDQLISEEERKRRRQQQLPGGMDPLSNVAGMMGQASGILGLLKPAKAGVM